MKAKKMKSLILLFFLGLLATNFVSAQSRVIKGTVIDENKEALVGVNVLMKGSDIGTTTGLTGEFSLETTMENPTLVFSYVGYKTKEILVKNELILLVSLAPDLTTLSEVVVIGYGTQKKSDLTGSVVSLSKERLSQLPNANFAQALQGSVPGLQINTNSGGSEGNELSILIRGRNSINAGNGPLIILDGIPYVGGISEINPADIESIEVLKDASAAAIYGSRGSNGIILITTKRGSNEKVSITYDGFYGIQQIARRPDLLTGEEFYNFKTTRINSPGTITQTEKAVYESGNFVDWYDLATRQGSRGQHSLSISGGSEKASFYLGATYLDVSGIAVNDDFKRYTLRPNLDVEVTPWLKIGSSSQLSFQDRTGLPVEFSDSRNTGGGANFFNPLTKPYNPDGSIAIYAWPEYNQARNPLSPLLVDNYDYGYRVFSANYAEIKLPLKGLTYKFNTGIEFEANDRKTYYGRNTAIGFQSGGTAETYHSIEKNLTVENILNYSKTFGSHSLNFTGLYSSQSNVFDR
ncbi:MAG: SusC/RagA family TonB-linked outer membrane protein, partial [Saprospiraceae bacterium]|nr:SusC/RagA family TonB-linked outer membrane protein [Saprospiraceae bacterium]